MPQGVAQPRDEYRDSRFRQRLDVAKDPRYVALKEQLAAVRRERQRFKVDAAYQRARADLWRQRALRKAKTWPG